MTRETDLQIRTLLSHWEAPRASESAIGRILSAAHLQPERSTALRWRLFYATPALAAAMLVGIVMTSHRDQFPKNDPALQQSALSVFSISTAGNESEELPE